MAIDLGSQSRPDSGSQSHLRRSGDRDPTLTGARSARWPCGTSRYRRIPLVVVSILSVLACGESASDEDLLDPVETTVDVDSASRQEQPEDTYAGPWIRIEPQEVDLGILEPGEIVEAQFDVHNVSDRGLRITEIDGSCDCLGYEYDRMLLPAGDKQSVGFSVRPNSHSPKKLQIWVQVNAPRYPKTLMTVRYAFKPVPKFWPDKVGFGAREVGQSCVVTSKATYELPLGVEPFELKPMVEAGARFTLNMLPAEVAEVGALQRVTIPIEVELDTSETCAPFRSLVRFEGDMHRDVSMIVSGQVHPGWYFDQEQVHLGVVRVGKTKRRSARLFYTLDVAPEILKVETTDPALKVKFQKESGASAYRLDLRFTPQGAGDFEGEIRVLTDQSNLPDTLLVKAMVRDAD